MTDVALRPLSLRPFWMALGLNFLWINVSEVFRYFAFVMPLMREALPMVPGIAPMNLPVFLIWGLWDSILILSVTFLSWIMLDRFGPTPRNALAAGTLLWASIFVILWLGLYNMNLAPASAFAAALPLAWIEMVVAAFLTRWAMLRE